MELLSTTHKIKQSLILLCKTAPIEKITVKQLIEFTRISRATFYNYYTNLTEVWQQITNDVLFEMSTLKKEPLVMFSFSDLQLLEQLAQYIKRRQFVIRMLLNKNGDPEFLEKWEQQMKCIILKYLNDKNIYEKKRRDDNYIDVLDAQRRYFDAQIGVSNAVRDEHLALVDLYKALGGGWAE